MHPFRETLLYLLTFASLLVSPLWLASALCCRLARWGPRVSEELARRTYLIPTRVSFYGSLNLTAITFLLMVREHILYFDSFVAFLINSLLALWTHELIRTRERRALRELGPDRCRECRYDLRGLNVGSPCPECGTPHGEGS